MSGEGDGSAARGHGGEGNHGDRDRRSSREDDAVSAPADEVYFCDLCGAEMLNLHCKLICERCGYKRDCSDP